MKLQELVDGINIKRGLMAEVEKVIKNRKMGKRLFFELTYRKIMDKYTLEELDEILVNIKGGCRIGNEVGIFGRTRSDIIPIKLRHLTEKELQVAMLQGYFVQETKNELRRRKNE